MFKINSFKYFYLPKKIQKYLEKVVKNQEWASTGREDIRLEPFWMLKNYIPKKDDLKFLTYDRSDQEYAYNPEDVIKFGREILSWLSIKENKFSIEMWEGSEDTGWHNDLNRNSDKLTIMLYYIPEELNKLDGGLFQTLADTLIPQTGDLILFEPKEDTYHQATKIKTLKKRYSIMIRVFK
jgi:hypothetical protein